MVGAMSFACFVRRPAMGQQKEHTHTHTLSLHTKISSCIQMRTESVRWNVRTLIRSAPKYPPPPHTSPRCRMCNGRYRFAYPGARRAPAERCRLSHNPTALINNSILKFILKFNKFIQNEFKAPFVCTFTFALCRSIDRTPSASPVRFSASFAPVEPNASNLNISHRLPRLNSSELCGDHCANG